MCSFLPQAKNSIANFSTDSNVYELLYKVGFLRHIWSSRGVSDDNNMICLNVVKELNKINYLAKLRGHQPTWTYQQPLENGNAITDTILVFIWRSG